MSWCWSSEVWISRTKNLGRTAEGAMTRWRAKDWAAGRVSATAGSPGCLGRCDTSGAVCVAVGPWVPPRL